MIDLGRFQLDLDTRTLRQNGATVHVGSRAFDILAVVVTAGGRLVTKHELMNAVWPQTVVEENNIQVHLSALRKILGADRNLIITVPGRGYQLAKRLNPAAPQQLTVRATAVHPLPPKKTDLVGRDEALNQIRATLAQTQVLTLVGAGGIGKTTLAIEAARGVAADAPDYVCFIELAALTTKEAVLAAIAQGCGLALEGESFGAIQIACALARQRKLLLLDNAEQVIEAVAETVEVLLGQSDTLRVLVTSREPLRIMAETIFRVDALDVPPPHASKADILARSAVTLFLSRANSSQGRVGANSDARSEDHGEALRRVGEICRRLDGLPLAIELAAARVAALGVEGVYRRLDDRMAILAGGYRTALPRHQTLRATFDWSYTLLDAGTKALFRRLAPFGGVFIFEAMCAVACDADLTIGDVICGISELVAKSLVSVELDGPVAKYRLSESTRAYALEKLNAEGETQKVASRNARYLATRFQAQRVTHPGEVENSPDLQQALEDARNAFAWAFSAEGDLRIGVELASNLVGTLLDCGMIEECSTRAELAVSALDSLPAGSVDAATQMRVRAALASALPYVNGPVWRSADLWREVLALAIESSDHHFHARALWGSWNTLLSSGNINESMKFARRFQSFAQHHGTAWQQIVADQLVGVSLHCEGHHAQAKALLISVLQRSAELPDEAERAGRFAVDARVFCNGTLARIAWLQGEPETAMALADTMVNLVRPETLEPSLTHVLGAVVVPLALMSGDLRGGAHYLEIMRSQAALHKLDIWKDCCECLSGYSAILNGNREVGRSMLERSLDALIERGFRRLITPLTVAFAEALVEAGHLRKASERLHEALTFCRNSGELLFVPEILRALGVLAQAEAEAYARSPASKSRRDKLASAASCFKEAIELARKQGARMWELRASTAFARLLLAQGREEEAMQLLQDQAGYFSAKSSAHDVRQLFELLGALRASQRGYTHVLVREVVYVGQHCFSA